LTGDFRGKAFGPFDETLREIARLRSQLGEAVYGVLGNHDSLRMLPPLEAIGIRMLVNESETIVRGNQRIHLAGVDDANYYAAANLEKAAAGIPSGEFSILLSHTPEIYKQAEYAEFQLCLTGHTHGGQICLPGSVPITLSCDLPRRLGAGPWSYKSITGYTSRGVGSSVIPVRFNGVKIDFSRPGKPTDNAYIESFNGRLRAECLDTHWFGTLAEAKESIEAWWREYNASRPHRALGERTPNEFANEVAASRNLIGLQTAENSP
jgi:hypothetical protein